MPAKKQLKARPTKKSPTPRKLSKPKHNTPAPTPAALNTGKLLHQYEKRAQDNKNPHLHIEPEQLLDYMTDPKLDPEKKAEEIWKLVRNCELRIEFYLNSPLKSIVAIPINHPDLEKLTPELLNTITPILQKAYTDAMLKTVAANQPGLQ